MANAQVVSLAAIVDFYNDADAEPLGPASPGLRG